MVCPKCGQDDIAISTFTDNQKRGCFMVLVHTILTLFTMGIWLIILLIRGKKGKEKTVCICKNCGYKWNI